ncbi:sensor histidine kinase [Streptomyces sp. NPDC048172]|uniref:sensor histidine kinase n=1 Tax=Streptomyces sp. NPDC048172 TaxID=3365505 RepID=UPI003724AEB4
MNPLHRTNARPATVAARLAAPVRNLFAPGMWPARRITREVLLWLVLGLSAAGIEQFDGAGPARAVAVGLLVGPVVALRRTLPATVVMVIAVGMVAYGGLLPAVCVASWSAGRRVEPPSRAVAVLAVAYVANIGLTVVTDLPGFVPSALLFGALVLLVLMVVPALVGRYRSQRRTLVDILGEYHAQSLRERHMVAGQARLRERQRIAQDMHDSLGHQLALISVHTGALEVDTELTGRQREAVSVLREASVAAMRELREVVGLLREPGDPRDPRDTGGAAEGDRDGSGARPASRVADGIEGLAETSRNAGAAVELRRTGEPRPLAPASDHAAYRIAQEGLTNAHKHAPGARITVTLSYEEDALTVEVANGPPPASAPGGPAREVVSGGQGLTGLGERTRLVGGMVHAAPTPEGGFRLAGVLPYAVGSEAGNAQAPAAGSATFVDPGDDLRQPTPGTWPGDGVPVHDGTGLPKELVKAVSRNRGRGGLKVGCGIVALAVLAGLGIGGYLLVRSINKGSIERSQYDAVKVGQSEKEVRGKLPSGDSIFTEGMTKGGPPEPGGAECLRLVDLDNTEMDSETVYRFCFKDGTLIEKKTYEVAQ